MPRKNWAKIAGDAELVEQRFKPEVSMAKAKRPVTTEVRA
jgi:hypothetical protein